MGLRIGVVFAFTEEEVETRHLNLGADMEAAIFHDRQRFIFCPDDPFPSVGVGDPRELHPTHHVRLFQSSFVVTTAHKAASALKALSSLDVSTL
jgi:hypothetical protein